MMNFDFNRFKSLVRWSMVMDRRWFVRTVMSYLMVMVVWFLFYTCVVNFDNKVDGVGPYSVCALMVILMAVAILVMGPTFMFVSMKGKHDDQVLMMLPASNLEKYLMRYSYWILTVPCLIVTFVVADVVQYVINLMLGHEWAMMVTQWFMGENWTFREFASLSEVSLTLFSLFSLLWVHSVYAVGATLFRSHKYNWLYTSIVLILLFIGFFSLMDTVWEYEWGYQMGHQLKEYLMFDADKTLLRVSVGGIILAIVALNFWLSYKIFCRTQVKGKFINI